MPRERIPMQGARMSRALNEIMQDTPTKTEVENLLYDYEYLDEVPQPYRSMLENADEWLRGGADEYPMSPMPSFKQTPEELGALYASAAEAKGVSNTALAIKAKVRPQLVKDFYTGANMPTTARVKIITALRTFGIDFGV